MERRRIMNNTFIVPVIDMEATGRNIANLRERSGLSVRELQTMLGFATPQAIYRWQRGETMPSLDSFAMLAVALKTSMDSIVVFKNQ